MARKATVKKKTNGAVRPVHPTHHAEKYGQQVNVRLPLPQLAALKAIQSQRGVTVPEQIRRAVTAWLEAQ